VKSRRTTSSSVSPPSAAPVSNAMGSACQNDHPLLTKSTAMIDAPSAPNWPCAKLMTPDARNTSTMPIATSP
jgi:hypothetical protein